MDTFKDFFDDLKDRISNPFVSSFALSWVAWNYEIIVALIFYKAPSYAAFMEIVSINASWNESFKYPLYFAFGYTFIFQVFKSIIKAFNSWLLLFTNKIVFKITKSLPISVEEHQEIVTGLESEKAEYVKLISSQKIHVARAESLQKQLEEVKIRHDIDISNKNTEADERISLIREQSEIRIAAIQHESQKLIEDFHNQTNSLRSQHLSQIDQNSEVIKSKNTEIEELKSNYSKAQDEFRNLIKEEKERYSVLLSLKNDFERAHNETYRDYVEMQKSHVSLVDSYSKMETKVNELESLVKDNAGIISEATEELPLLHDININMQHDPLKGSFSPAHRQSIDKIIRLILRLNPNKDYNGRNHN